MQALPADDPGTERRRRSRSLHRGGRGLSRGRGVRLPSTGPGRLAAASRPKRECFRRVRLLRPCARQGILPWKQSSAAPCRCKNGPVLRCECSKFQFLQRWPCTNSIVSSPRKESGSLATGMGAASRVAPKRSPRERDCARSLPSQQCDKRLTGRRATGENCKWFRCSEVEGED